MATNDMLGSDRLTSFVLRGREETLLIGDHHLYTKRLTKRILVIRRRLGLTNAKNAKYKKSEAITKEKIEQDHGHIRLLLLNAERCWAKAMYTKSIQPEDSIVTGANRIYIITKLNKAARFASTLHNLLKSSSDASETDVLQARAYHASLVGAAEFEKQSEGNKPKPVLAAKDRWARCLQSYATTRVIYQALSTHLPRDLFQDFVSNTVDPLLRYIGHQSKLSRSIAVSSIAITYFPKEDTDLLKAINKLDPDAMREQNDTLPAVAATAQLKSEKLKPPTHITWGGINAEISDAAIGQALAQVALAHERLVDFMSSDNPISDTDKAAAYDDVLLASQDAVDAAKRAIDELESEGIDESDPRMQDLRVTGLYVQFELISWRIGRNRVLIGDCDGIEPRPDDNGHRSKRIRLGGSTSQRSARLRQQLVLYDATLQSIESIKAIRGAQRDSTFISELDGSAAYFEAAKSVLVAASHATQSSHVNALALLMHARKLSKQYSKAIYNNDRRHQLVPKLDIGHAATSRLQSYTERSIQRLHALAEMTKLHGDGTSSSVPLIHRLCQFPSPGATVDLKSVVPLPPRFETIPVKPIFLDVAWNYIDYPGRASVASPTGAGSKATIDLGRGAEGSVESKKEKKSGWFGFGR